MRNPINKFNFRRASKIVTQADLLIGKAEYVFVFGHMRSRSSVLAHVLGSNQQICGYREVHRHYHKSRDLYKLRLQLLSEMWAGPGKRIFLDKIVGPLHVSKEVLNQNNVHLIYMLRPVEPTLQSLMKMIGGWRPTNSIEESREQALDFYCKRLTGLRSQVALSKSEHFYIDSDDLVKRTEMVLKQLSTWLNLKEPLTSSYNQFQHTGVLGHGDPSGNIKTGSIVTTLETCDYVFDQSDIDHAEHEYQLCREVLIAGSSNVA